jgi:hypothetical protein
MNLYKKPIHHLLSVILIMLFSLPLSAQMFSADEIARRQPLNFETFLTVGFEPMDFEYKGGPLPQNARNLSFSSPIYRVSLENDNLGFTLGFAGRATGLEDRSFFNLGVRLGAPLRLINRRAFRITAPFQLATELSSVQDDQAGDDFQQSTLTAGIGPALQLRISDNLRISTVATPAYGFSVAAGGFFGGQIYTFENRNRLLIGRLLPNSVISLGYSYKFQRFDIEQDRFDYNLRAHTFILGISF